MTPYEALVDLATDCSERLELLRWSLPLVSDEALPVLVKMYREDEERVVRILRELLALTASQ